MIKLVTRCSMLLAVAAATAVAQTADGSQNLRLLANTPTVTISPIAAGRQPVMLPGVSLTILAVPACDAGWQPRKLSLSVADIRKSTSITESEESGEFSFDVEIPKAQLAPVVIEDFCLASKRDSGEENLLRLTGYMSAQGALRCSRGEEEKVSYTSRAFDVLVRCEPTAAAENESEP